MWISLYKCDRITSIVPNIFQAILSVLSSGGGRGHLAPSEIDFAPPGIGAFTLDTTHLPPENRTSPPRKISSPLRKKKPE